MKKVLSMAICFILVFSLMGQVAFAAVADKKLLSQPYDLTLEQMVTDEGNPFGGVELHFKIDKMPQAIGEPNGADYWLDFERKIDNGEWEEFGFNPIDMFGEGYGYEAPNKYVATDTWDENNSLKVVSYRARMMIYDTIEVSAATPWSNIATLGLKTSEWSSKELERAISLGLVPESMISVDLTKSVTRAEFAAISVKLYEKLSGKKLAPSAKNPFSDTKDTEVLKAYGAGIAVGISASKFQPNTLVTREEAATMLVRVLKKVKIPGWTFATDAKYKLDFKMPPKLADDAKIASWAKESVYFMIANGIISGTNDNAFKPQQTASARDAASYASATREQALVLSLRVVERIGSKKVAYKKAG